MFKDGWTLDSWAPIHLEPSLLHAIDVKAPNLERQAPQSKFHTK